MKHELTKFQVDLLSTLYASPGRGSAALDELEEQYQDEQDSLDVSEDVTIPHGRLYQNLDTLVEAGLVVKKAYGTSDRAHRYELTEKGENYIRAYVSVLYHRVRDKRVSVPDENTSLRR